MADRYWIGDGGAWSSTTHWSDESGGTGGFSVPTTGDGAYFDVNSFTITGQTVTVGTVEVAQIVFESTLAQDFTLAISTSLTLTDLLEASEITKDVTITGVITLNGFALILMGNEYLTISEVYWTGTQGEIGVGGITIDLLTIDITGESGTEFYFDDDGTYNINALTVVGANIANILSIMSVGGINGTFTINKTTGTISLSYCNIEDSIATGGATFSAFTSNGCIDGGNNTGWNFVEEHEETINDEIGLTDTVYIKFPLSINESIVVSDSPLVALLQILLDSLFIYDDAQQSWLVTNTESLVLVDTLAHIWGIPIDDWITIVDSQSNNWNGREIIADGVMVWDISGLAQIYLNTLTDPLVLTDTSTLKLTVTILEYLGFNELATSLLHCAEANNSSLVLTDSSLLSLPQSVTDILNLVDTNSMIALFANAINEALGLTDTNSLLRTQVVSVTDPLVFVDTISNLGRFYSTIQDTLALDVTVELSGEVWQCYVLNTPKFHPSMYSGFNFNSYCVFENRAFGANDTGIFELTGSTDAGSTIHTGTILSQTDFGLPNQKRFRRGYLGITGTSPVMVFEAEDGTREAFTVDTQGKVVGSSELKSKKWILSIADYDSLDHLKLIPIILTK